MCVLDSSYGVRKINLVLMCGAIVHEATDMIETPERGERLQGEIEIKAIAEHGLGFGEGVVSVQKQIEAGDVTREAIDTAKEVILDESNELFETVGREDDGCGDGRLTVEMVRYLYGNGELQKQIDEDGGLRAKIFGGGLVVAASMLRSTGLGWEDATVLDDRMRAKELLEDEGMKFGAHTDDHAEGGICGCGAIDKSPRIAENVLRQRENIMGTLAALYGGSFSDNQEAIEHVFSAYEKIDSEKDDYFQDAEGDKTMDLIKESGATIKTLGGKHLEDLIILNDVEGTSFNQQKLDEVLADREVDGTVQAFVVDIWRGREYAKLIADFGVEVEKREHEAANEVLSDEYYEALQEKYQRTAMADFLVRTVAVAGTLTAGDLPVIQRKRTQTRKDLALAV